MQNKSDFSIKKHSLQHVMVLAVRRLFRLNIQLGVGPVIDEGFYQDFGTQIPIEKFPLIQKEMESIIEEDLPFSMKLLSINEAQDFFSQQQQAYKVELLETIKEHGTTRSDGNVSKEENEIAERNKSNIVSIYTIGEHVDLCRGPHVDRTSLLKDIAFQIDSVAGAYWRGDQSKAMLCRVYALAFENQKLLEDYITNREEAKKRDHKKLGEKLELFFFHSSSPGMAYWLPKGVTLKNTLIQFWRQYHEKKNYKEIQAPLINKRELWEISGHWKYYKDDMVRCDFKTEEEWALKPMNCANAMIVWKFKPRSYKELPLRFSDTDILHRNEKTGSLSGLFRSRCFCQDDAHNFVTDDQIKSEIIDIISIVKDFYGIFGLIDNVHLYLSTRPDDFMGDAKVWEKAENELREILDSSGLLYGVKDKDGAFYGPKIDIHLKDSLGREWQCGTIQLDFQLPANFELEYTAQDGSKKCPIVIHRVIYGSLERFIGILIEHFAGRLPFWIAPVQVRILPVKSGLDDYLSEIKEIVNATYLEQPLRYNLLRYEVDNREETLAWRVKDAEEKKIPCILIFGEKEKQKRTVMLRSKYNQEEVLLEDLQRKLIAISTV
jgi:threonyl-tRNA synthetase